MSVLIKGMKMPDCWNCPCLDGEYGECNILGKTIKSGNGRRADCPFAELPDHGDLIDRDALKEPMESVCMGIMAGTDSYNAPLKTIDDAPVIIPAERSEDGEN